jgi:hypothetical protein
MGVQPGKIKSSPRLAKARFPKSTGSVSQHCNVPVSHWLVVDGRLTPPLRSNSDSSGMVGRGSKAGESIAATLLAITNVMIKEMRGL